MCRLLRRESSNFQPFPVRAFLLCTRCASDFVLNQQRPCARRECVWCNLHLACGKMLSARALLLPHAMWLSREEPTPAQGGLVMTLPASLMRRALQEPCPAVPRAFLSTLSRLLLAFTPSRSASSLISSLNPLCSIITYEKGTLGFSGPCLCCQQCLGYKLPWGRNPRYVGHRLRHMHRRRGCSCF